MATSRFPLREQTPYKTFESLITKENWNMFFEVQLKCSSEVPIVSEHLSHLFKKNINSLTPWIKTYVYIPSSLLPAQRISSDHLLAVYWLPQ